MQTLALAARSEVMKDNPPKGQTIQKAICCEPDGKQVLPKPNRLHDLSNTTYELDMINDYLGNGWKVISATPCHDKFGSVWFLLEKELFPEDKKPAKAVKSKDLSK